MKTSLFSKVGFSKYSLFNVNDRFRLYAELVVERTGGLNSSLEIIYATRQFPNKHTWFDFNGFKMHPAIAEYDYDEIHSERVAFESGQKVYKSINFNRKTNIKLELLKLVFGNFLKFDYPITIG